VLQTGEMQRVGSSRTRRVDVRVISATNTDIQAAVAAGDFREDLLFRLCVVHVHVPPLREHSDDIRPLVDHFVSGRPRPVRFSDAALRLLERYRWPGNVRELQNTVEQAIWRSGETEIGPEHLPEYVRTSDSLVARPERRRQVADDLYEALTKGGYSFWSHIHPLFLSRDITRHDVRQLVRRGLQATRGSYRGLVALFGMESSDYQRFHNFLAAHGCQVDYREFRRERDPQPAVRRPIFPLLTSDPADRRRATSAPPEAARI
jgi:DNA-binding NtrC family response regulator